MTDDDALAWCRAQGVTALTSPHGYVLISHPDGTVARGTTLVEAILVYQSGDAHAPTPALEDVIVQTLSGARKELAVTVRGFDPSAPLPPPVDPLGGLGDGSIGDGT